jgi:hypothetical protein
VATGLVATEKVFDMLPAGTVTLADTVAADVLLLERVTKTPPVGAGPLSVTVPVEEVPPVTLDGLRDTEDKVTAGVTVKIAVLVVPAGYDPEIVTCVELATVLVVTENVAVVDPAGTVTLGAATCATPVLLLERLTTAPPVGAGPLRVTVPVEELPPVTETGFRDTELRATAGEPPYTA